MFFTVLASAVASVITGTALVATRFVVVQTDGLTIATLRYLVAAACLLTLVPIFYQVNVARRDILPIAGLGILYFCLFPWCISSAVEFTTASGGAIILACTPAVTLLLGNLTGSEPWTMRKGFGVGFAIIGATTAISHGGFQINAPAWRGDLLMIGATFLGAFYAVFSKSYVKKYSPLIVTALAMGAGAVGLMVCWLTFDSPMGFPDLDLAGWVSIYYIGIAGGALSFFLYAWALGRTTATTMMIFLPLNPISALIAGGLFLQEPLSIELFLGLALVVIGIILVVGMNGATAKQATAGPVL